MPAPIRSTDAPAKMDAELKARWVAALRSGEYRQGLGRLWDGKERHCCLGVLCDVAGFDLNADGTRLADESSYPELATRVGAEYGPSFERLWHLNDGVEAAGRIHSFAEIADYIEETL